MTTATDNKDNDEDERISMTLSHRVDSEEDAHRVMQTLREEANAIIRSATAEDNSSVWYTRYKDDHLHLLASTLKAPQLAVKRGLELCFCEVPIGGGQTADEFYEYIMTQEGYTFIDPDADPADFNKPIREPWKTDDARLQLEYAKMDLVPYLLSVRDYIVLDCHVTSDRTFYCSTIQTNLVDIPGSSAYDDPAGKETPSTEGRVRMLFWSFYRVVPVEDKPYACKLQVAQYVDLGGWVIPSLCNPVMGEYYKLLSKRAQKQFPVEE